MTPIEPRTKTYDAFISAIATTIITGILLASTFAMSVTLNGRDRYFLFALLLALTIMSVISVFNWIDLTRRLTKQRVVHHPVTPEPPTTTLADEHHADLFRHALRALEREMLTKQTRLMQRDADVLDILSVTHHDATDTETLRQDAVHQIARQLEHVELMYQEVNRLRTKDLDPYVVLLANLAAAATTETQADA